MNTITRRGFARGAGVAAISYSRIQGANDRVGMGLIGVGGRGRGVHRSFLEYGDSQTVAVCDLREDYMDLAVKNAVDKSRSTPRKYKDYHRLLEDKAVDAVMIATPDHWHALMFIDACNAGKDVYIEKPFSLTVYEGRRMVDTAERTRRVVQVGTQRRSAQVLREAVEYVRSGGLGPVTVAKCYDLQNEWPNGIGRPPDEPPPTDWEWDQWLGPAPWVPYNRNRAFYNFRWFYDYSGGQLTNFGVHFMDVIRWILSLEWPRKVTAIGGHYAVKDNREIPDTLEVVWEFDGPTLVTFSQIDANAAPANLQSADMELRGTKGTMYIHLDRWEVVPEAITEMEKGTGGWRGGAYSTSKKPVIEPKIVRGNTFANLAHVRNFLDCVKSRARCNADALTGHVSTATVLLGNIALKTESLLKWDGLGERFTNNPAANSLLHYQYRAPYKLG